MAYDDRSKTEILNIPKALFEDHGSVSPQGCAALAEAARRLFHSDLALAETSIAGPTGATSEKPVGLAYVAVASQTGTTTEERRFQGTRQENREAAKEAALSLLETFLATMGEP